MDNNLETLFNLAHANAPQQEDALQTFGTGTRLALEPEQMLRYPK